MDEIGIVDKGSLQPKLYDLARRLPKDVPNPARAPRLDDDLAVQTLEDTAAIFLRQEWLNPAEPCRNGSACERREGAEEEERGPGRPGKRSGHADILPEAAAGNFRLARVVVHQDEKKYYPPCSR